MSHMLNDNKKKLFLSCDHCQTGFSKGAQITHETFGIIGNKERRLEHGVLPTFKICIAIYSRSVLYNLGPASVSHKKMRENREISVSSQNFLNFKDFF